MVICLERDDNDLHNYGPADATVTPSSLVSLKSRMAYLSDAGLPRLSMEKRPLNGCLTKGSGRLWNIKELVNFGSDLLTVNDTVPISLCRGEGKLTRGVPSSSVFIQALCISTSPCDSFTTRAVQPVATSPYLHKPAIVIVTSFSL